MPLPIMDFLVQRMTEYDPSFEHRAGTAFNDLFMQPLSVIIQPLWDEAGAIQINQSLLKILEQEDPNSYDEEAVDALVGNLYVTRREGNKAYGTARVLYATPQTLEFLDNALEFTNTDGLSYFNVFSISVTEEQMAANQENEFYYIDVQIQAELEGDGYNVGPNEIVSVADQNAVRVYNQLDVAGGLDREANTELITRTRISIGVRDMNTYKGMNAILYENFLNTVASVQAIGFMDPEMMRDVVHNYHVGGRIDSYVKTRQIETLAKNFTGIPIDFERLLDSQVNLQMLATDWTYLGKPNINEENEQVRGYNIDDAEAYAEFFSGVDLTNFVDLSVNQFINVGTDDTLSVDINISGTIPEKTAAGEIARALNAALGGSYAETRVNPVVVSRRNSGVLFGDILSDPTDKVFDNIFAGDVVYIPYDTYKGNYKVIAKVSSNDLQLEGIPTVVDAVPVTYRISRVGTYVMLRSTKKSHESFIEVGSPVEGGTDALFDAFGLLPSALPYKYEGKGKYAYEKNIAYEVNASRGEVRRIIGPEIIAQASAGKVDNSIYFDDDRSSAFLNARAGDVVTILDGVGLNDDYKKDYRVFEVVSLNRVRLDKFFPFSVSNLTYELRRTDIKDEDLVQYTFQYNPLSVDIGNMVQLDDLGRERGVREGREDFVIEDVAFLYIEDIEVVDPTTGDLTGEVLEGKGGYGRGGYGRGGYGIGSSAQYRLVVNVPEHRFSNFEDSLIDIDAAYLGSSLQVRYRSCTDIVDLHDFAYSDKERVLDADVLMKHYLPAVVDMDIEYYSDPNDPNAGTPEDVQTAVGDFLEYRRGSDSIDSSDIIQVVLGVVDPTKTSNAYVRTPVKMTATIHNTDGTRTIVKSGDSLQVPEEPIPSYTERPLSPNIVHWIIGSINIESL